MENQMIIILAVSITKNMSLTSWNQADTIGYTQCSSDITELDRLQFHRKVHTWFTDACVCPGQGTEAPQVTRATSAH